jgi:hypothetical protein
MALMTSSQKMATDMAMKTRSMSLPPNSGGESISLQPIKVRDPVAGVFINGL